MTGGLPPNKNKNTKKNKKDNINTNNNKNSITPNKKKNKDKVEALNVLVLGETGSGKSTFINTITNFYRGGNLTSLRISIPTKYLSKTEEFKSNEFDVKNTTSSKTDSCNSYVFVHEGKQYNFIDTPGLSDTRGTQKDDENLDKIIEVAAKALFLNAIIIVINGTTPRMTVNLQNVFTRLRGCLPDVLFNNILVVFTNCLKHTCNFDLSSLGTIIPKEVFFMNNSAFSSNPKKWDQPAFEHLTLEWKLSMQEIKRVSEVIARMETTTTKEFEEMKKIRFNIKQTLHIARLEIKKLQELQDHLSSAKLALGKYDADANQFKNYTRQKIVSVTSLEDAGYHSTICSPCNHVCHDHCGLLEISSKGSNAFKGCFCMGGGDNCRMCPGKCSYTTHYHARKTMKTIQQTLDEVLHDMKAKYDAATKGKSSQMSQITNVQTAKDGVEKAIQNMSVTLETKCNELKKICSGFNLVDELHAMIMQLETESRALVSLDARTSANNFIRSIRQVCDNLSASQAKVGKTNPKPIITNLGSDDKDSDEDFNKDSDDNSDSDDVITTTLSTSTISSPKYTKTSKPHKPNKTTNPDLKADSKSGKGKPCKVCGQIFFLTKSEIEWYKSKNLAIPRTCKPCKQKRQTDKGKDKKNGKSPLKTHKTPVVVSPSPNPPPSQPQFCKVCGLSFILQEKERDWFVSRNIPPPRSCKPCRDKK